MWPTQRPTHLVDSRFPDWPIRPCIFDKSCDRFSTNEKRSIPYAIFSQKISWMKEIPKCTCLYCPLSPVFLEYSRREHRGHAQVRVRRQRRVFWIFETAWSFSRGFVLCLRAAFCRLYRTSFSGSTWPLPSTVLRVRPLSMLVCSDDVRWPYRFTSVCVRMNSILRRTGRECDIILRNRSRCHHQVRFFIFIK